jgi:hypothetical protein
LYEFDISFGLAESVAGTGMKAPAEYLSKIPTTQISISFSS